MIRMTETSTFTQRVEQLRAAGHSLREANRIALAEERARNEQTANETYRRD